MNENEKAAVATGDMRELFKLITAEAARNLLGGAKAARIIRGAQSGRVYKGLTASLYRGCLRWGKKQSDGEAVK